MSEKPAGGRRIDPHGAGHAWIRNNILGLVAIFIALSGSAVAAQVGTKDGAQTAAKKKKAKPGPRGPAGPQGAQGIQGIQGPPGALAGAAGGDLTGTYPNPQIGPSTVGAAEVINASIDFPDIAPDAIDSSHVLSNSLNGSDINETLVNIPVAWADVSDDPLASTDPTLNAAEGVNSVDDGVGAGTDGFFCFDLAGGPVDMVMGNDQLDQGNDMIVSGESPQAIGCDAPNTDAQVIVTNADGVGTGNGDIYVAFYDQ